MNCRFLVAVLLTAIMTAAPALAPAQATPAAGAADPLTKALGALDFRNIGPATTSGRVDDLAVYEHDPSLFYVGTSTGGLWKTTNNATTWEILFDDQPDAVSIGAVALAQDDPDIVWVGTGEANNRQSSSWGNGVYKSIDGGQTWRHMGLADSRHIARIVVHPEDHDVVYVAALGHLWGPSDTRGVYRTSDGGLTWSRLLFVDHNTGVTELLMDPSDSSILYAATYQRRRSAWGFNGGGPGSGLYKSRDSGRSWTRLTSGLPEGPLGRIGLDIYAADPSVLFATVEHASEGGIYRSDDAGSSWSRVGLTNPRPMYFSKIRIDPEDEGRIYLLAQPLLISDDGGVTFSANYSAHPDHHALWINPMNPDHLIGGNDGGIAISYDRGQNWTSIVNMDLAQVYHVGFDMARPYRVYAGLQDNMAWGGPSAVRSRLGIGNDDWFMVGEYDGFATFADPENDRAIYAEAPGGRIFSVDRVTNERRLIQPEPTPEQPPLRWNWNAPFIMSPHNSQTLLVAANRLFRSTDGGHSWRTVSPDITSGVDRDTLMLMGVPGADITLSRNDGVSAYPTITAVTESPARGGLYYAGADDGSIHRSDDGGRTWLDISERFPSLPPQTYVAEIVASRFDVDRVYVAFDGHRSDDYRPYVYVSDNRGESWLPIVAGLPAGHVVRSLAEDLKNPDLLFLGTEFGLFVSLDRGEWWSRLSANLPTVPVYDIRIHPRENDLILGTHGRGIWILDDITPLQQLDAAMSRPAYLFDVRPASRIIPAEDRHFWGDQRFWGENSPFGALVRYYLARPAQQLALEIRDSSGMLVRRFDEQELPAAAEQGLHRIEWDLRHSPLAQPLISVSPISVLFSGTGVNGPLVPPGEYELFLLVDGKVAGARTARVDADPASRHTLAELEAADDARMVLYEMHYILQQAEAALRDLGERLTSLHAGLVRFGPDGPESQWEEADLRLREASTALGLSYGSQRGRRGRSGVRGEVGALEALLLRSTAPPTEAQAAEIVRTRADLIDGVRLINGVIQELLPAILRGLDRDPSTGIPLVPEPGPSGF